MNTKLVAVATLAFALGGGSGSCPTDVDGDGETGIVDFLEVLSNWGPCP